MSDQPVYTIRIAAQLVGVHQQTLRTYEREGLLTPARSSGRQRLYSEADIERLRLIRRLIDELGVNLAGADIILRLPQPDRRTGTRKPATQGRNPATARPKSAGRPTPAV